MTDDIERPATWIVHRDITADAELLAPGEINIADLGIAAAPAGVRGTPGYVSPELLDEAPDDG